MGVITLPWSMEQDRQNNIKANSVHVDDNFDTLLTATNKKLEQDGSIVPTADLPMGNHKITQLATPTLSGDATTKGYVDTALAGKADWTVPTQPITDNSTKIASTEFVIDVLKSMYPVGSIYIGTQNTCPMGALFGTWALVSTGRALWGGDGTNGNTTIAAGLPNITGDTGKFNYAALGDSGAATSALYTTGSASTYNYSIPTSSPTLHFNASRANSIFGNSSTVQPPAYVVNVWRRTA